MLVDATVLVAGERLAVLAREEQRRHALAFARRRGDRARRALVELLAQAQSCPEQELGHRVALDAHDLGDLVVGELLDLAEQQREALARAQAAVRAAHLVLEGREQGGALGVVVEQAELTPRGDRRRLLRDVADAVVPALLPDELEAEVPGDDRNVGTEVEVAPVELLDPLEHPQERLLRGVGRVLRRRCDTGAELVHATLVAAVERLEGLIGSSGGELDETVVVQGFPSSCSGLSAARRGTLSPLLWGSRRSPDCLRRIPCAGCA